MKIGSLGIAVISLHLGAKNAFWRETPPHMGGITANPKEAENRLSGNCRDFASRDWQIPYTQAHFCCFCHIWGLDLPIQPSITEIPNEPENSLGWDGKGVAAPSVLQTASRSPKCDKSNLGCGVSS